MGRHFLKKLSLILSLTVLVVAFQNCSGGYKSVSGSDSSSQSGGLGEPNSLPNPGTPANPGPSPNPALPSAFVWPNASTTGVPANVTLAPYTGPMTITQAGTVIDGKIINGTLTVKASNVVIKNSRITFSGGYWGVDVEQANNATIQDCDIVGPGTKSGEGSSGIFGVGTFLRNDISKVENGINLTSGSATIKGNFIHDLLAGGADPHYDGIQVMGGQNGVLIEDNTILAKDTSDVFICNFFGPTANVTVNHNFLGGSVGINIYVEGNRGQGSTTNVTITNNVLAKGFYDYFSIVSSSPSISGNIQVPSGTMP